MSLRTSLTLSIALLASGLARGDSPGLRRIGRMPVWVNARSDAPAARNAYYSLGVLGDGRVMANSIWETPQLFQFHPASSSLEQTASVVIPNQGNEDSERWTLRVDRSGPVPHVFWHIVNYENLDGLLENGTRDGGVFVGRVEPVDGILSSATFTYTNMPGNTVGLMGPGRRGIAYDPVNKLLFSTINGPTTNPVDNDIFQVFRFNADTGGLEGRLQVWEIAAAQNNTFIDVAPEHNLVMLGGGQLWRTNSGRLYLAEYEPTAGAESCTISNLQYRANLQVAGTTGITNHLQQPQCAVITAGDGNRLFAIVGGGRFTRTVNPAQFSNGLYLFELGAGGGPYTLDAPIARIPFDNPVEFARVIGTRLVVSSFGLHVYDLDAVLAARGVANVPALERYPLPYATFEFDTDTSAGAKHLFLAGGSEGIDIFTLGGGTATLEAGGTLPGIQRAVPLRGRSGSILLETGGSIRHIGRPTLNDAGQIAVWATTDTNQELILRREGDASWTILAATGSGYVSFSRPSLNNAGEVAFWAGREDGSHAIRLIRGTQIDDIATTSTTHLRFGQPEIGAGPRVIYWAESRTERKAILSWRDGATSTVITEAREVPFLMEDYDVSPDGATVVFVSAERDNGEGIQTRLTTGDGTMANLFDRGAYTHRQRLVRLSGGGVGALSIWGSELAGFMTARDGVDDLVIRHRTPTPGVNLHLLYVGGGMANSRQESIFLGWPALGAGANLYVADATGIARLVGVGDRLDGGVVRDVAFVDGFNDARQVVCTMALRDASGRVSQRLLQMPLKD